MLGILFVFLQIATFSSVITGDESNHNCETNQFRCGSGQCISLEHICDGAQDCPDNSDETHPLCTRISAQNTGQCVLPSYPEHGTYVVEDMPNAYPGVTREYFELTVSCRRGYGFEPFTGGSTQKIYCIRGKWLQNMPKCVRYCRLNPDPSVRYMCYMQGSRAEVCKSYVPSGAIVEPVCNTPIYYTTEVLPDMRCVSGYWNYVALCKAECGRITPDAKQLITGGRKVKRGELPWHVGIYWKSVTPYLQICGGSLVKKNLVISAAHCFWKPLRKVLPSSEFAVAAGKLHRSWESEEDIDTQKSDVKEIIIPSLFAGEAANYQEDIAAVILASHIVYTSYIRPVCLDFGLYFDMLQLQHGNLGKVAGWGLTSAKGGAAETLMVVDLPFINDVACTTNLPETFREYITGDKFCAGYSNGTALCQGDSGGGLAFSDNERGIERYYLRGVVSVAPNDGEKQCNDYTYTAFTKIRKHQDLIKGALATSETNICPSYSFQCTDGNCVDLGSDCDGKVDCPDGSDESEEYCLPRVSPITILNQNQTQHMNPIIKKEKPELFDEANNECLHDEALNKDRPWHADIYLRNTNNSRSFICAGVLISSRHVITVAHLLPVITHIEVDVGTSLNSVSRRVVSAFVASNFDADLLKGDLSVLKIDKELMFNKNVRAACLWNGKIDLDLIVGRTAYFYDNVARSSDVTRVISLGSCRDNNRPYEYLSLDNILCTEDNASANTTLRTVGAGLFLLENGKLYLRGILMVNLRYKNPYSNRRRSGFDYGVFVDLAQYLPWINKIL